LMVCFTGYSSIEKTLCNRFDRFALTRIKKYGPTIEEVDWNGGPIRLKIK
jgi:hypothetical protein